MFHFANVILIQLLTQSTVSRLVCIRMYMTYEFKVIDSMRGNEDLIYYKMHDTYYITNFIWFGYLLSKDLLVLQIKFIYLHIHSFLFSFLHSFNFLICFIQLFPICLTCYFYRLFYLFIYVYVTFSFFLKWYIFQKV